MSHVFVCFVAHGRYLWLDVGELCVDVARRSNFSSMLLSRVFFFRILVLVLVYILFIHNHFHLFNLNPGLSCQEASQDPKSSVKSTYDFLFIFVFFVLFGIDIFNSGRAARGVDLRGSHRCSFAFMCALPSSVTGQSKQTHRSSAGINCML